MKSCALVLSMMAADLAGGAGVSADAERWPAEKANAWYEALPWLVGCNFIPSNAINQLEMWQKDTFDPELIDQELGWAVGLGFNTVRVYLHDLAWEADAAGFKERVDKFLEIANGHGIRPAFVIFDDCWNDNAKVGPQPKPIPSVHNSGWLQSPGLGIVNDPEQWGRLELYVKDVVGTFGQDERILFWDLYNEPGNNGQGAKSLPLVKKVFEWARAAGPTQPLTVGTWFNNEELNEYQLKASDIITFHNYHDAANLRHRIARMKTHGRPLICTEWLRRGGSDVATHLPIFKEGNVGCYNWGLVSGKTQTIWGWGTKKGAPEPELWFHDLLRQDGTPFDAKEKALFVELTARK
jgi:hypothetical protein